MSDGQNQETHWWDTTSLGAARGTFRSALQKPRASVDSNWSAWLAFFIVANVQGRTRFAAQCLEKLITQSDETGISLEKTLPRYSLGTYTRIAFRGLLALAEQEDASLSQVRRVFSQVDSFFMEDGCSAADRAVVRLSLAPRLGLPREPGDVLTLEEAWQHFQRILVLDNAKPRISASDEEEGNERESGFHAICTAAAGQTLVECLLEQGRQEEAQHILDAALEREPCIGPCGLAPQGMLAAAIDSLERGDQMARSTRLCERLALVAPVSAPWLIPTGVRVHFLARSGDHAAAAALRAEASTLLEDREVSAWQRLHYLVSAIKSLELARLAGFDEASDDEAGNYRVAALKLAQAFDDRNGNTVVSGRLGLTH